MSGEGGAAQVQTPCKCLACGRSWSVFGLSIAQVAWCLFCGAPRVLVGPVPGAAPG